jgi:hypothetical protein
MNAMCLELSNRLTQSERDNPVATHEHSTPMPNGDNRWRPWINLVNLDKTGDAVGFRSTGRITRHRPVQESLPGDKSFFDELTAEYSVGVLEARYERNR